MFLVNTYQWEWTTIAALIAPQPLLFANSDNDPIFPMDGNRRIIDPTAEVLRHARQEGQRGRVRHRGRPRLPAGPAASRSSSFFNKHLKGDTAPVKDADFPKIDGQGPARVPDGRRICRRTRSTTEGRRDVRAEGGGEAAGGEGVRGVEGGAGEATAGDGASGAAGEGARPARRFAWTEASAELRSSEASIEFMVHGSSKTRERDTVTLVVLNPDDGGRRRQAMDALVIRPGQGRSRSSWPSAHGTRRGPEEPAEHRRAVARTARADGGFGRVHATWLRSWTPGQAGPGTDASTRRHAVRPASSPPTPPLFVTGCVDEVVILDPPTSHRDGPHFLNVMRVLDIPEALGLLAPDVKLTLIGKNAKDKAFDRRPRSTSSPGPRTSSSGNDNGERRRVSDPMLLIPCLRGFPRQRCRPVVHGGYIVRVGGAPWTAHPPKTRPEGRAYTASRKAP